MTTTERMKRIRTLATLVVAAVAAMALALLLIGAKPSQAAPATFGDRGHFVLSGGESSQWDLVNFLGTDNFLPVGGSCEVNSGLGILDASIPAQGNAFDRALLVFVNNQQYVSRDPVDLTGTTLTSGPVSLSGLNTSVQYYASPTNATLRTFISLNNPTTNSITVPVTVATNLGSDGETQIINTSSGDTTFTTADRYIITDDAFTTSADPRGPTNTSVVAGSGTPQTLPSAVSNTVFNCGTSTQGVLVTYDVTVPAGETRSLVLFNQLNSTPTQATTDVGAFNDNTTLAATDFLAGLSQSDLATVVNFDFTVPDNTAPSITAPPNITVEATGPDGAAVEFGTDEANSCSATDNADPEPVISYSAQSGSTFPIGTTPVTCTATDGSGNSSTATFSVTVEDTMAPKVTSTSPRDGGEVGPAANIRATFSEDMREASVVNAFKLFKKGSTNRIAAQVTYDAQTDTATLNPTNNLRRGVTYKAVVTTLAKDVAGNGLDQNSSKAGLQQKVWFFEIDN